MAKRVAKVTPSDDTMPMAPSRIILPPKVIETLKEAGATEIETGDTRGHGITTPHLSHSQVAMYLRCSMQYKFRYILGLKDKPSVSLAIGSGGHAALDKSMKRKIKTGETNSPDEVVQWASDFMDLELTAMPPSEYEKDVEPGETKDKFLAATRVFQTRDAPTITPIAAELQFNLDLNEFDPEPLEEPIRIANGKIDILFDDATKLVVKEPGIARIAVRDYKYAGRKKSQNEVDLSPQLSLYAVVVKKITGLWPSSLGLTQLYPGNTKEGPNAIELNRAPELTTPAALAARMRRIVYQFKKVEEGIRKEVFIPVDDPITCSWCGFRQRCQGTSIDDFQAAIIRAQTTPPE